MDKNPVQEGFVLQVAWYDSPEVLASVLKDPEVEACFIKSLGGLFFHSCHKMHCFGLDRKGRRRKVIMNKSCKEMI